MTLYLIGLGLNNEKDITIQGLEAIKRCDKIFLETYTSKLSCSIETLEKFYNKKIIPADRNLVENNAEEILNASKTENVAFLVVGDIFSATTHHDLRLRAIKQNIKVEVINNVSIMTAIGITGLDLYKFGRTTTIVFPQPGFAPETPYDVIKMNQSNNLHTLCLLDIKSDQNAFMDINEALHLLLAIEEKRKEKVITEETKVIACARIGTETQLIKYGTVAELKNEDFGPELHTLIIPSKLHFVEEEVLEQYI
jgi:diphthine synthase